MMSNEAEYCQYIMSSFTLQITGHFGTFFTEGSTKGDAAAQADQKVYEATYVCISQGNEDGGILQW